jgi:uncharacterized protein YycO
MYIPSIEEVFNSFQSIAEEFVDTCKECGNILRDGFDEIEEDIQQDIIDKADTIGLGEPVCKHYKEKNKRKEKRRRLQQSMQNLMGPVPVSLVTSITELHRGDHLCISGYGGIISHHAIYIGKGKMIHYAPDGSGEVMVRVDGVLYEVMNEEVRLLKVAESYCKYSGKEVVSRAFSQIGEKRYNLLTNNCEHFARWCRCGGKNIF